MLKLFSEAPDVCCELGCGGAWLIPHEDGWQCVSCMRIIHKDAESMESKVRVKRYEDDKNLVK